MLEDNNELYFSSSIHLYTLHNIEKIENLNRIVSRGSEIEIVFGYPLDDEDVLKFNIDKGFWCPKQFTFLSLILAIRDGFIQLYNTYLDKDLYPIGSLHIEEIRRVDDKDVFTLSIGT